MAMTLQDFGGKLVKLARREILRDGFLLEAKRWVRDRGDKTLRLDYDLDESSIVLDVGGYEGDFAAEIFKRYGSTVHIFEPVPSFHALCLSRFADNPKVISHCFGLSDKAGSFPISVSENGSSFVNRSNEHETLVAELRSIVDTLAELNLQKIDLLKINIEGGEYEILPACIDAKLMQRIRHIQVQFHNFVENADVKRDAIRSRLAESHNEDWCYEYIWEGWSIR